MYLAIKIRGSVGTEKSARTTFTNLNLTKNNGCMVYPENSNYLGMLNAVKDYIAYGIISKDDFTAILEKKAYVGPKKLKDALTDLDYKNIESLVRDLFDGKTSIAALKKKGLKVPFRLKAPSKGYKGIKKGFNQGGELGFHGKEINKLLKKML